MTQSSLMPGVVTGDAYKALVDAAKSGGYALPAVNVTGTNTINAVMEAAAKANSDIIIQLSNTGGQFYAGRGLEDAFNAKVIGSVAAAQHAHLLAEHYRAFEYQVDPEDGTPYKKQYDPRAYLRLAEEGIVERLLEACDDLGSKGRSIASA